MTPRDYENLILWVKDKVDHNDFGEIHVTIKLRGGKAAILQRSFMENVILTSGQTGGGQDEHQRR